MAGNQFKDGDSCGPDIYFLVVASPAKHFGGSVEEGAGDGEHIHGDASSLVFPADAKIDEFQFFSEGIIENILGLYISMCN